MEVPRGYHRIKGTIETLPRFLPIPAEIRVLQDGLVLDNWMIVFPFSTGETTWFLDMVHLWFLLDDSKENARWLDGVLEAVDSGYTRYWESRGPEEYE